MLNFMLNLSIAQVPHFSLACWDLVVSGPTHERIVEEDRPAAIVQVLDLRSIR